MIPGAVNTVTHGTCIECGWVGFLGNEICKDCIQKRAVEEHFAPPTVDKLQAATRVVKIKKQWS